MFKIFWVLMLALGTMILGNKAKAEPDGHDDDSLKALHEPTAEVFPSLGARDFNEPTEPRLVEFAAGGRPYVLPVKDMTTDRLGLPLKIESRKPRIFAFRGDLSMYDEHDTAEGVTVYTVNVSGPAAFVQAVADALAGGVNDNIDGMTEKAPGGSSTG